MDRHRSHCVDKETEQLIFFIRDGEDLRRTKEISVTFRKLR